MDRVAVEGELIGKDRVEAGEIIALYAYGLHRSKKYWDAPDSFEPDRFSDENKAKIKSHTFIPFGKGPRLCIGSQFAQMEMNLVLYHFIKRFDFQLVEPYTLELETKITIRPKHGMPMTLSMRRD